MVRNAAGQVEKLLVQRMELGAPDDSGRRRPVPIEGEVYELEVDTIITAVSQAPDTKTLGAFEESGWMEADAWGGTRLEKVWAGGDSVNLGLATISIGQGRKAALSIHAALRGEEPLRESFGPDIGPERIIKDFYEERRPAERRIKSAAARLADPEAEIDLGITQEQALAEVERCFSCGLCFGCERCWMFCTPGCFGKKKETRPGDFFTVNIDTRNGCKKCSEECPCGCVDLA